MFVVNSEAGLRMCDSLHATLYERMLEREAENREANAREQAVRTLDTQLATEHGMASCRHAWKTCRQQPITGNTIIYIIATRLIGKKTGPLWGFQCFRQSRTPNQLQKIQIATARKGAHNITRCTGLETFSIDPETTAQN